MRQREAAEVVHEGEVAPLKVAQISLFARADRASPSQTLRGWMLTITHHELPQEVGNAANGVPEEAAPGTDIPDSPDIKAPQATGNVLEEHDSTLSQTAYDQGAFYWQPGPYHAPPVYASGWYYQDVQGHTQGPFTKQQLQLWRQHLPMDLSVWFIDQNGGSSHSLELAKVLGDGRLLESWRKAQPTKVCL